MQRSKPIKRSILRSTWMSRPLDARFEQLLSDLRGNGCFGACAVGLPGVGAYERVAFREACRRYPCLFQWPVSNHARAMALSPSCTMSERGAFGPSRYIPDSAA